jgi:hypothetical protein
MDKKAFIDKLTAQLKQWDADIEKLKARAEEAQGEAKTKYNKKIQDLRDKKEAARDRLEEVKQASEEAWEKLKSGTEKAFNEMKDSLHAALSKFK